MKKIFLIVVLILTCSKLYSQVPFNQTPSWISTDITSVSTGGMFADLNQDGWLDYVVSNGNDIARQKVVVYYNNGDGTLPTAPNWQSSDIDYHGHLDVGDINGDGYPDVAVSVYIGPSGFNSPGKVKLYLNNAGTLSSNPSWVSADNFYTFSCAFGDADGDGDLDLAAAGGESYNSYSEQQRIYYNIGGTLQSSPSWKSNAFIYSYDVNWFDMNNDGDLDLVFANEGYPNYVFQNNSGVISTTPIWQSADASMQANSLFIGDVNNDGYLDLAISDNNQLGGTGRFKIYLNNSGMLNTTPFWTSAFAGYGSGILLADIDNDDDLDLITGAWWNPIRIYLNNTGSFNSTPDYTSSTTSVVEAIFCGDVTGNGIQNVTESFTGDGSRKLFYLPKTHLQYIDRVIIDGDTLQLNEYCYDLECGWFSLANAPASGVSVIIEAAVSWSLEMGVTNWDSNIGNYLFTNTIIPVELVSFTASVFNSDVKLNWTTATELNNHGFDIERSLIPNPFSQGEGAFESIGFVPGFGTTTEPINYSFTDENLSAGNYQYRLKQIDLDGTFEYSNIVEVSLMKPDAFALAQNYPNPFNPSTIIHYTIPTSPLAPLLTKERGWGEVVTLKVYDVLGNEVATLVNEIKPAGTYEVEFNASAFSSGVYFYQLRTGDFVQTKKMTLIK